MQVYGKVSIDKGGAGRDDRGEFSSNVTVTNETRKSVSILSQEREIVREVLPALGEFVY